MANGARPVDYDSLVDEIIELIRADNTADSATVARMVEQLQELRAVAGRELLDSEVRAGEGLTGGGKLADQPVLALSDDALAALDRARDAVTVDQAGVYATKAEVGRKLDADAQVRVLSLPFTRADSVSGREESPVLPMPEGFTVDSVLVSRGEPGGELNVSVAGIRVRVGRDATRAVWSDGGVQCPEAVRVVMEGESAGPIVVNILVSQAGEAD